MGERPARLDTILYEVKRRWTQRSFLRAVAFGSAGAAVVVLAGWGATALIARQGIPLLAVALLIIPIATFMFLRSLWAARHAPTDRQVARLIEEREERLDDVVATAVDYATRPDASARVRASLADDAARALDRFDVHLDRVL